MTTPTIQPLARPHVCMPNGSMDHLFDADRVNADSIWRNTEDQRRRVTIINNEMWDQLTPAPNIWRITE